VRQGRRRFEIGRKLLASVLSVAVLAVPLPGLAQAPPATRPSSAIPPEYTGRTVEEVRLIGKNRPLSSEVQSEISHVVRTQEGDKFDPDTVAGDYQRIYGLKKFSNVEARVQPTMRGVIVIYEVTEQDQIKDIRFRGNDEIDTKTLQEAAGLKVGEAIDPFRMSLAKETIERLYRDKNYPYAHVVIDQEELARNGVALFNVIEGPHVRIRKVRILGNKTFSNSRIRDEVKTKSWFPFFVAGTYDPEQVEQDVAAIRKFYEDKGFFDVRVGRKIVVGPTQKEIMVDYVIEEGPRYAVDQVSFQGNHAVPESELRKDMKLNPGMAYDQDLVNRDVKTIVKDYSPLGYIYIPPAQEPNPPEDYMRVTARRFFKKQAGKVDVVYDIHEGKPFQLGRIIIKGNAKAQDKVVLREMRLTPGQLYNSDEVSRAIDRIKATNLFNGVTITPIGEDPSSRDLLVEVNEAQSARFMLGAGVTSNSGILGNITYEQRNFDITNWPSTPGELLSNRAFTGAGQTFRLQFEPGTELTRARMDFIEPWIFDQPYSFGNSVYLSQRLREDWIEQRIGDRVTLGHRFNDIWSASVALRGEQVTVRGIQDMAYRAPEILDGKGDHMVTSITPSIRRDTTDSPLLPSKGTITTVAWERYGALGGDYGFDKFTGSFDWFTTVYEDLLDRKTILSLRTDVGYINGSDAPFFERFYGGGIGSIRGFRYRGVSPRSGVDEDPIGGNFIWTGTAEVSFPLVENVLRGVLFTDIGTVEKDVQIGTLRMAVGAGVRITLPFFGQLPIALDFGFPVMKSDQDETRLFSFSLGLFQ
jgi:outer membrane protein insertion porin family